eukprot:1161047-Pelagomonas_calceolata.AAC.30
MDGNKKMRTHESPNVGIQGMLSSAWHILMVFKIPSASKITKKQPFAYMRGEAHLGIKHVVHCTWHLLQRLREQIVQQAQEDGRVIRRELAQVEVAQRAQQHLVLRQLWGRALHTAGHVKGGLDGAQLPVIVARLGQQVLAQLVPFTIHTAGPPTAHTCGEKLFAHLKQVGRLEDIQPHRQDLACVQHKGLHFLAKSRTLSSAAHMFKGLLHASHSPNFVGENLVPGKHLALWHSQSDTSAVLLQHSKDGQKAVRSFELAAAACRALKKHFTPCHSQDDTSAVVTATLKG